MAEARRFHGVTINMGCLGSGHVQQWTQDIRMMTISGTAYQRQEEINTILESQEPDVVFGPTWEESRLIDTQYTHRTEASPLPSVPPGIMWKTSKFQEIDIYRDIQTHLASFQTNTEPMYQIDGISRDIRHRVCTVLLRHTESDLKILVVSWHGPDGFDNAGENKIKIYRQLLKYAEKLALNRAVRVAIGGNFNLRYNEQNTVPSQFTHALTTRPDSIRNILYKNIEMRLCQDRNAVLNHDDVSVKFTIWAQNIRVMTINMGGPGTDDARLQMIKDNIQSVDPDIIFAQEIGTQMLEQLGLDDYVSPFQSPEVLELDNYRYGHPYEKRHLQIMFKSSQFQTVILWDNRIQTPLESFRANTQPIYQVNERPADITGRICTLHLRHIQRDFEFWVHNWHGPHNFDNSSVERKQTIYEHLLKYVKDVAPAREEPILIGGDFNLTDDELGTSEFEHIMPWRRASLDHILYKNNPRQLCQEIPVDNNVLNHKQAWAQFAIWDFRVMTIDMVVPDRNLEQEFDRNILFEDTDLVFAHEITPRFDRLPFTTNSGQNNYSILMRADDDDIQTCLASFKANTPMYQINGNPADITRRVRTILYEHTRRESPILVVNWHGPDRLDNPAMNKILIYEQLLQYVEAVARNSDEPVLIVGNFNLAYREQMRIPSQFTHLFTEEEDRMDNILYKNIAKQCWEEECITDSDGDGDNDLLPNKRVRAHFMII